jgi:glutamate-1-semialdehyde 2,1-aminomutase
MQAAQAMARTKTPLCYQRVGSMATLFFAPGPVESLDSLKEVRTDHYAKLFHALLARGVYFPPAQYEAFFVSLAHTEADLDRAAAAIGEALTAIAS